MSHRASCHEMTTMDREESSGSGALIVAQRSRTDLAETASVESLRRDREAHRHRQIWTKDAHGGPYRKAVQSHGLDPLTQNMDGSMKKVELGYERAETGPTTNFVGNHMTQGAIDLVQAELGQTRLLKNSLQKRIDIKIKTVEGCQRKLPAVIMSDGISQRKVDDLSHSKVGVVDLTQIVPSDGKPDLNTLRKYIRRNRS